MKRYFIVSTFPKEGSKNIGDKLIEERTIALVRHVKGDCEIQTVWREDDILRYLDEINRSDALIFACLAIRRDMRPKIYNFPASLAAIKVPIVPLASGTSFRPLELSLDALASRIQYDPETVSFLHEIGRRATVGFSCRGEITYNYLRSIGITNAEMTGDVAFFNPAHDALKFDLNSNVGRIAVSTPHQPKLYAELFYAMVGELRTTFPNAEIDIVVHGESEWIDPARLDATIRPIYLEPTSALDLYLDVDVHVGFRVHGHVSALSRRKPSYLLATDGRGYDYANTLRTGTAWGAWKVVNAKLRAGDDPAEGRLATHAELSFVSYVADLVRRDAGTGFSRFLGFEREIERFNRSLVDFVRRVP